MLEKTTMKFDAKEITSRINHYLKLSEQSDISRADWLTEIAPFLTEFEVHRQIDESFYDNLALLVHRVVVTLLDTSQPAKADATANKWFELLELNINSEGNARRFLLLGDLFLRTARSEHALPFLREAYEAAICANLAIEQQIAFMVALASTYNKLDRYQECFELCQLAFEKVDTHGANISKFQPLLNSMCFAAAATSEFDDALRYGTQFLENWRKLKEKTFNDHIYHAYVHNNLGTAWLGKGDLDNTEQFFRKGLELNQKIENKLGELYSYRGLGRISLNRGAFNIALQHLNSAAALAEEMDNKSEAYDCYRLIADTHQADGDFEQAYEYFQRFHEVYVSVAEFERKNKVDNLQTQHQADLMIFKAQVLRRENEKLEQRVDERASELITSLAREEHLKTQIQNALTASEQVSQLRSDMLKTISNELQTPVCALRDSAEPLRQHMEGLPPSQRGQHFQRITTNVKAITDILNKVTEENVLHQQTLDRSDE